MTARMTPEAVAKLLEGATPGPWVAKHWTHKSFHCIELSSATAERPFGCVFEISQSLEQDSERQSKTADLAAAAPDLARALIDALERERKLREALEQIAKVEPQNIPNTIFADGPNSMLLRARAAARAALGDSHG